MKKALLTLVFLTIVFSLQAQDTIVNINDEKIEAKVIEISSSIVKYKKFSNIEGPIYSLDKDEIKEIHFKNGEVEVFKVKLKSESNSELTQSDSAIGVNENAQVYFIRSTGFAGSMSAFTAFIDGDLVCKLNNKKYSIHDITPGEHVFSVQFAGKKSKKRAEPIIINIEAGETYYIQMVFQTGAFKNNLYCQEVTGNSAKTVLIECVKDTKCF